MFKRVLFKIDGIKSVMLGPDFITINKEIDTETNDWEILKPQIFSTITEFFETNLPVIKIDSNEKVDNSEDSEVVQAIKELLDTKIR